MRVEVTRGDVVESSHQVDVVVADLAKPVVVWGESDRSVIPRSAIKFIQALPLLRTGAADRYDVSEIELALACSSHSGERDHIEAVAAWLQRIGCSPQDLECGPSAPIGDEAAIEHHRAGAEALPIINCCSGKHAGFLTVARLYAPMVTCTLLLFGTFDRLLDERTSGGPRRWLGSCPRRHSRHRRPLLRLAWSTLCKVGSFGSRALAVTR